MTQKQLFLLVEGSDDERFCELVLKELFIGRYFDVQIILYSKKKPKEVNKKIRQFKPMGHHYILFADLDGSPCITQRKVKEQKSFRYCDEANIQVIVQEIESWYLAGADNNSLKQFKLPPPRTTDTLTKEQFNSLIPAKLGRVAFMVELLNLFSLETAVTKNTSFHYFVQKYQLFSHRENHSPDS